MADDDDLEMPHESPSGPFDVDELENRIAKLEMARESENLSHEAQVRGLIISEITQRIRIRWATLIFCVLVVLFMSAMLIWASFWYFWGKLVTVPSSVAAVMFLAPILSITTITAMLAIGAFRRKGEDMDGSPMTNLAAEGARAAIGGS